MYSYIDYYIYRLFNSQFNSLKYSLPIFYIDKIILQKKKKEKKIARKIFLLKILFEVWLKSCRTNLFIQIVKQMANILDLCI